MFTFLQVESLRLIVWLKKKKKKKKKIRMEKKKEKKKEGGCKLHNAGRSKRML